MINKLSNKIKKLPKSPGVYFFLGRGKVLYVGKATSLRDRVRSYWNGNVEESRSPLIEQMIGKVTGIDFEKTDSVLEALLLESKLIKEHQPPYNIESKDDKSFNYVVITKEEYPRVLLVRGRNLNLVLKAKKYKPQAIYGPFPYGGLFKEAIKLVRRLFPYRDDKCVPPSAGGSGKLCFNRQIGLCPGVCTGEISATDYRKHIHHLKLFFEGKKSILIRQLHKEMKEEARLRQFEKAEKIKRTIFALKHIQDVSLLKDEVSRLPSNSYRIEAYDVAHISGTEMTGAMTVVEDGVPNKNEYRKFKVRTVEGANDTAALAEILRRRLKHLEWPFPQLIVVDGGVVQRNSALSVLKEFQYSIPVVSVVKNEYHRPKGIEGDKVLGRSHENEILLANSEAHRFAIGYHRARRRSNLRSL